MNEMTMEKIKASKDATRARMRMQTVRIDKDWRIVRADPLNWEIQYEGKFKGYYGTIVAALRALPAKMLDEEAKGSLSEVLRSLEGIRAMIDKAFPS